MSAGAEPSRGVLVTLARILDEHREDIIDFGTDWVREHSIDLKGRRPRHETRALVTREFGVYRALLFEGNLEQRARFIEDLTSLRAAMLFEISTVLRGFLCFRNGVLAALDRYGDEIDAQQRLDLVVTLDAAYFDTIFTMSDVYTSKLKAALRETQTELIHKEKMAALGGLVAGVAHEINTPVGVALTAGSLLHDRVQTLNGKFKAGTLRRSDMKTFLADATEAAALTTANLTRAGELITSFKRVAVDQTSDTRRRFELGAYVREVLASLRPMYKRQPVEVTCVADAEVHVRAHAGAISQVVTNLVTNALTHAYPDGAGGRIELAVGLDDSGDAVLRVRDDGRGMEASVLARAFEPFFTTRRGQGGSGLGLHIVHNLITELLGGVVELRSRPGEGTSITIHFPVEPRE